MAELKAAGLASRTRALLNALTAALTRGVKQAANEVNKAARANLAGGDKAPAWSYPVPARRGNLRRLQQWAAESPLAAYVFNTAEYAGAIHSGYVPRWAGRGKHVMVFHKPRAFLDDAVTTVDPLMVITRPVQEVLQAWG